MRKHVAWYVRGLYDNSTLCREVNHAATPAETEELLRRYLEKIERAPVPFQQAPAGDEEAEAGSADVGVGANGSCTSP
jgi:hypothetical protein